MSTTTETRYKPSDFGPGKSGPQMQWLNMRLILHGVPIRLWGDTLRDRVAEFQRRYWSSPSATDGLIGPKTLEKLYESPIVDPGPPSSKIPADILNLKVWKETLPIDSDGSGSPDEVKQPKLSIYSHPKFFHVNHTLDGVVFRADCDGFHTENSFYPRSELREQINDGKDPAKWNSGDGKTHTMYVEQAITHLPEIKEEVVAGQIHDAKDDVCMVKLEGTRLIVQSEYADDQELDDDYQLGDRFSIKIYANKNGITIEYNGVKKAYIKGTFTGCYFKAGCYTQATSKVASTHPKYGTGYGEVVIYDLEVTHG